MATFRFQGIYQTHVALPDESVRLTEPGEIVDLPFDEPGPLWTPITSADAVEAAAAAAKTVPPESKKARTKSPADAAAPESEKS